MSEDLAGRAGALAERVRDAHAAATPLDLSGGGSKAFYGRREAGSGDMANRETLRLDDYRGVISYEPTELVITAAAGTPLAEIESLLAEHRQMLGFEPPYFGAGATLGGTVACGLSGPRRPFAGAVRDHVLGVKIINGRGEILSFGGQVMKNVAGYDLSRLMCGALGTLGVILEVSLRTLPQAAAGRTLLLPGDERETIRRLADMGRRPWPLSGAAHLDGVLYLRLEGAASAVSAAAETLGGETLDQTAATEFWRGLREHELDFFREQTAPLWRLSLPPATGPLQLPGHSLLDWGGAQRWLITELPEQALFAAAATVGGHAERFRGGDRGGEVFQPLPAVTFELHRRLKQSFDPAGILNPGRLYADL